jgi:hypothetical protein
MWQGIRELDQILRGQATRPESLHAGEIRISILRVLPLLVLLGAVYGFFMSWYGIFTREELEYRFVVAAILKTPALFMLTLMVTFPSLYVFNALVGSRLSVRMLLKLVLAALGVTLAVLASFGPVVAFFSATTSSYHFIGLLNVALFALAGALGVHFLLQTLGRLVAIDLQPIASADLRAESTSISDYGRMREARQVFYCWVVAFALVGVQMSWVLRPFIGDPEQPFSWFRPRESNFFAAVVQAIRHLFV